jgi:hypothetical protein
MAHDLFNCWVRFRVPIRAYYFLSLPDILTRSAFTKVRLLIGSEMEYVKQLADYFTQTYATNFTPSDIRFISILSIERLIRDIQQLDRKHTAHARFYHWLALRAIGRCGIFPPLTTLCKRDFYLLVCGVSLPGFYHVDGQYRLFMLSLAKRNQYYQVTFPVLHQRN